MRLENVKEFSKRTKTSKSTIYRFYKKNEDLWLETKFKYNKRLFPVEHEKYFNSELLHDENKVLSQQNKSMRNLIDCLMDKDSLQQTLWYMDWSFFGAVAYKFERNKKSCFRMMNALFDELNKEYGDETELRMFFSTEPFKERKGYHNHFVVFVEKTRLHEAVMDTIDEFFYSDRLKMEAYNKYEAGLFYICKDGLINEDWDILLSSTKDREKLLELNSLK